MRVAGSFDAGITILDAILRDRPGNGIGLSVFVPFPLMPLRRVMTMEGHEGAWNSGRRTN